MKSCYQNILPQNEGAKLLNPEPTLQHLKKSCNVFVGKDRHLSDVNISYKLPLVYKCYSQEKNVLLVA